MRAKLAIFASVVLCGNAAAEPTRYAVDGLAVGAKLNFASGLYREFKCSPSEQFDGFTWCQKTRTDVGRRGPYLAGYSVLHSTDGNVSYVNRSQDAGFANQAEAQADINRYSRSIGEQPRITKLPQRSGLPDGLIATWGAITLKPLDPQSIKILAEGKSPKKGFLIDYLGDLTRSAREGLPIYRMDGGPGFVWAASFGLRGRGSLRVVAVDTSGFVPAAEQPPTAQSTAVTTAAETKPAESGQSIDQLQAEITNLNGKIADLETAAAAATEGARGEAAQARAESERAIETAATEKAQLEAVVARLQTVAADAKTGWWQKAQAGAIGGLLGVLTTAAFGFFMNRRKASVANQLVAEPRAEPIDLSASQSAAQPINVLAQSQDSAQPVNLPAQSQNGAPEIVPHVASPEIAATEAAVGLESGDEVKAATTSPPSTVCAAGDENLGAAAEVSAPRSS
jgi:hypothetical protein